MPRFKILSPLADPLLRRGRVSVKIAIDATPDPVKAIRVEVNGRKIGDSTPNAESCCSRPSLHRHRVGRPEGVSIEVVSIASVTKSPIAAWTTISIQVSRASLRFNRKSNRPVAAAESRIACRKTARWDLTGELR